MHTSQLPTLIGRRATAVALTAALATAIVAPSHAATPGPQPSPHATTGEATETVDEVADPASPPVPPGDIAPLEAQPRLEAAATCSSPQGFSWELVYPDAPAGASYHAQYRVAPDGPVQPLPPGDSSGFVPAADGTYQVRGVVTIGGDTVLHEYDWVETTVHCPGIAPVPTGDPAVAVVLAGVCRPGAGVEFAVEVTSPPAGSIATVAQWRDEDGAFVDAEDGPEGFLPTGEGTYEVRGVLHHQGPGFYSSPWQEITVSCDPHDGPEHEPEDAPRRATPTFTG